MSGRIKNPVTKLLVAVSVISISGAINTFAADWPSLLKQGKTRYAEFEKEIKDMAVEQEMTMVTPEQKVTSESKLFRKADKFRMETKTQIPGKPEGGGGMEAIVIFDGKDMWMISPFLGKQKLPEEKEKERQAEKDWWGSASEKAKIVGSEKVGSRECYVVEMEQEAESHFHKVWLDKKSLLVTKAESKEAKGKVMVWVYSDFRKIKGDWEMPYRTEIYEGGKLLSTTVVKSLKVNKGLSDDLFNPDKVKTQGSGMQDMMKMMMKERTGK